MTAKIKLRQARITMALESYTALARELPELTEEEVLAALKVESGTRRRQSIIDRLIARASRLHEINYTKQLKEKYHGNPPQLQDHVG